MKLYDSKEISAILKKATMNSSKDNATSPNGLSIDELRQLASEVGIDPEQIEKAVAELEMDSKKIEHNLWGGPFSYSNQVLVEGEITNGQWEEMLISICDFFQSKGNVTTRESVFEWSSPWGTTNSGHVTALNKNGKTKISVSWNAPLTAVPFYVPVPLVSIASLFFASGFLELTAVPGVTFTLLVTGLTFLVGRWRLRKHLDNGFKKLQKLVANLGVIASTKNQRSESDLKQVDASRVQTETNVPLLKINEEENQNKTNIETAPRNRSRT